MICEHKTSIPTRRVLSNGNTIVFLQCQECGNGRALKTEGHKVSELPAFDPDVRENFFRRSREEHERSRIHLAYEQATKTGEWWKKYSTYLKSDHWRQIRRIVTERDRFCQVCLRNSSVQAHHLSYASFNKFGVSFAVECVGVCSECHDSIHRKEAE